MKVESIEQVPDGDLLITGWCGWWPLRRLRKYIGHSTIWRDAETGQRAGTFTEGELCDIAWLYKKLAKNQPPKPA